MWTLALLRHAHALVGPAEQPDHDRALSETGRKSALAIGRHLCAVRLEPKLVLCSSALRAVETLECLRHAGLACGEVRIDRALYLASAGELRAGLSALGGEPVDTLLIGHNPGIQALAVSLAIDAEARERRRLAAHFSPGCCALIRFDSREWSSVGRGGRLETFSRPDELEP